MGGEALWRRLDRRGPAWLRPALRGLMVLILLAMALTNTPPVGPAFGALAPFFLLGLFTRLAAATYFVGAATLVMGSHAPPALLLQPWFLAGAPTAVALLALGAGRWALDPVKPGVIWARGVGAVLGDHPTNRAWRGLLETAAREEERRRGPPR